MRKTQSVLLLLILAFGSTVPIFGQETTGSIEGTVSDQQGARVTGAILKIEGNAFTRTEKVADDGFFRVLQIPPGTYKVSVTASNFSPWISEDVKVVLGKAI